MSESFKDKKNEDALATKLDQKKQDSLHAQKLAQDEKKTTPVRTASHAMSAETQGSTGGQALGMDRDTSLGAVTVTTSAIHVRTGASASSASLGMLRQDDRVRIYAQTNGFLQIHIGDQVGYIDAQETDFGGEMGYVEKKRDLEIRPAKRAYTGTKSKCDNPVYAGFVACLEALGVENPSHAMAFDVFLEDLRRKQRLRGGGMRRFSALANALGVNVRAILFEGDDAWKTRPFWGETVREALEAGDEVLVDIDGTAMRVVEVSDEGVLFEGGRSEQRRLSFHQLEDIGWVMALGG